MAEPNGQNGNGNGNGNGRSGGQRTGADVISSPTADTRTFTHRGTEIGEENVDLSTNRIGEFSPVLVWTMPKKYTHVGFAGGKHISRFELRTLETMTGTTEDDTEVELDTRLIAVAGEEEIEDQPFPTVVAYNVTQEMEIDIVDVDYTHDTVTLADDPAENDEVKLWPVMTTGRAKYTARDAFNNATGPLDEFGVGIHSFADFDQEKNTTQIHMVGAGTFREDEQVVLQLDADQEIVWEDPDYPNGSYVSKVQQRFDVEV